MSEVIPFSNEMIAKLVKAGYLRPEHRHDPDAIASAIDKMRLALRSGRSDDKGPFRGVTRSSRRFPPPWTVEDHNDACFIVKDRNGYALAYFYYEEESGRRGFSRRGSLLRSGGRFAGPEHDDFRADRRAVVEIDDVLVRQADAARRDVGANGPGFIGAV